MTPCAASHASLRKPHNERPGAESVQRGRWAQVEPGTVSMAHQAKQRGMARGKTSAGRQMHVPYMQVHRGLPQPTSRAITICGLPVRYPQQLKYVGLLLDPALRMPPGRPPLVSPSIQRRALVGNQQHLVADSPEQSAESVCECQDGAQAVMPRNTATKCPTCIPLDRWAPEHATNTQ